MHAHSKKYLEVTVSNADVISTISQRIRDGTPFALSRIGDGEIYILNNNAPDALKQKICNLWGFAPEDFEQHRKLMADHIIDAINHSDLLGILDFNNEICKKMNFEKSNWSLSLDFIANNCQKIPVCCDHQIPRSIDFGDPNNFKRILNGSDINIITPNIIDSEKISKILDVNVSITKVSNNREELLSKIDNIRENVVLYGVSLTAKDLGIVLKSKGKIALDFGATIDAWSGLESRPWFKSGNLQHYCLIK